MIDARLPLLAAQGAQVDLAGLYQQAQQRKMQAQQMEMQREELDFRKQMQQANLDEKQREAAKAGIADMHAAVQWADTPEKWAQVQQHYAQYDPQLAQVPFEARESALVRLGQMGKYMEATKPDIRAIEPGGSLFSVGPQGVKELVRANPGQAAPASPVGAVQEGATATNPQTGEKIIYRNGQWQPMGGTAGNGGGNFPSGQ